MHIWDILSYFDRQWENIYVHAISRQTASFNGMSRYDGFESAYNVEICFGNALSLSSCQALTISKIYRLHDRR